MGNECSDEVFKLINDLPVGVGEKEDGLTLLLGLELVG